MLWRALSRLGTTVLRRIPFATGFSWRHHVHLSRGGLLLGGVGGWLGLSEWKGGMADGGSPMVGAISHVLPSTVQIRVEMSTGQRLGGWGGSTLMRA